MPNLLFMSVDHFKTCDLSNVIFCKIEYTLLQTFLICNKFSKIWCFYYYCFQLENNIQYKQHNAFTDILHKTYIQDTKAVQDIENKYKSWCWIWSSFVLLLVFHSIGIECLWQSKSTKKLLKLKIKQKSVYPINPLFPCIKTLKWQMSLL